MQSDQSINVGQLLNEQPVTVNYTNTTTASVNTSSAANPTNRNTVKTNNENSPPKIVDFYIKRPKSCNLLDVSET